MFAKTPNKRKHPVLAAIVSGAAVAGAIGVFSSVKSFCARKMHDVALFFKKEKRALDDKFDR